MLTTSANASTRMHSNDSETLLRWVKAQESWDRDANHTRQLRMIGPMPAGEMDLRTAIEIIRKNQRTSKSFSLLMSLSYPSAELISFACKIQCRERELKRTIDANRNKATLDWMQHEHQEGVRQEANGL